MGVISDPRLQVLVVTSDQQLASRVRQSLQVHGAHVHPSWSRSADDLWTTHGAHPHVVVTDLTCADVDPATLLARLIEQIDGIPIVVLTAMKKAQTAAAAACHARVVECAAVEKLTDRIESALGVAIANHECLEPLAVVDSAAWQAAATLTDEVFIGLTRREAQVMSELADGNDNPTIGRHLGVGVSTVSTYLRRLREKLGVRTRGDLIEISMRHLGSR